MQEMHGRYDLSKMDTYTKDRLIEALTNEEQRQKKRALEAEAQVKELYRQRTLLMEIIIEFAERGVKAREILRGLKSN